MSRMAKPFCLPQEDREEEVAVEGGQPADGRRPREAQEEEAPDEYESPDEDTGQYNQHYQRLEELLFCIYNVFRIALLPPPPMRRRNANRGSGRRRQQVVSAGDRDAAAGEPRGAVPRRRQRVSAAMASEAARPLEPESDGEGDGLLREMAAEARRRAGRRRLSSRTVATETDEEPPRGSSGNCQLPSPAVAPAGARRSMSTSSTQCSYEDWAEAEGGAGGSGLSVGDGGGEEEEAEEEEDDVFVASRPGDAHPPPRPPSPPPPSSNPSAPGDSRPSGGGSGSLQSRRQRRKRNGGDSSSSSSGGGRQRLGGRRSEGDEQAACTPATPASDEEGDPKMAALRKAEILRKQKEWDAVSRELRNLTRKYSSQFKQVDEKAGKGKKPVVDRGGAISALLSPLLPSTSPGLWTLVAVCVGAQVIGRLW